MRDPKRIDKVIADLRAAWHANPDWRLGQLVINAGRDAGRLYDAFYVEDDEMQMSLRKIATDPS